MNKMLHNLTLHTLGACALMIAAGSASAAEKMTLGVSIPTATHSFTAGIVWWANKAKEDLEKAHPDLKVIVKTAANAPEQANQHEPWILPGIPLIHHGFRCASLASTTKRRQGD